MVTQVTFSAHHVQPHLLPIINEHMLLLMSASFLNYIHFPVQQIYRP